MEVEEEHTIKIVMTYDECRQLAKEIDLTGFLASDAGKDPVKDYPMLTELWNKLP